jgi:hypothetical protein
MGGAHVVARHHAHVDTALLQRCHDSWDLRFEWVSDAQQGCQLPVNCHMDASVTRLLTGPDQLVQIEWQLDAMRKHLGMVANHDCMEAGCSRGGTTILRYCLYFICNASCPIQLLLLL